MESFKKSRITKRLPHHAEAHIIEHMICIKLHSLLQQAGLSGTIDYDIDGFDNAQLSLKHIIQKFHLTTF